MDQLLSVRKSIHLPKLNYLGERFYFVTVCCFQKRLVFDNSASCSRVLELLSHEAHACHFSVPAYCLMPDHLHFLAQGREPTADLLRFLKTFKLKTSRNYFERCGGLLWQRRFFDHVLRPGESI